MSSTQWVIGYLCIAALVAGGGIVFAAWSRKSQQSARAVGVPVLVGGAIWPVVVAGLAQWLLVFAIGKIMRRRRARTSDVAFYGPPAVPRSKVNSA